MSDTDLRTWAAETAPTLTEAQMEAGHAWVYELDVRGFEPPPIGSTVGTAGYSLDEWRALIARVEELADGLHGAAQDYLAAACEHSLNGVTKMHHVSGSLLHKRLIEPLASNTSWIATPLGRAVLRALERRDARVEEKR